MLGKAHRSGFKLGAGSGSSGRRGLLWVICGVGRPSTRRLLSLLIAAILIKPRIDASRRWPNRCESTQDTTRLLNTKLPIESRLISSPDSRPGPENLSRDSEDR